MKPDSITPYLRVVKGAPVKTEGRMPMSEEERIELEEAYPYGLTTAQLLQALERRGLKFSEANLRSYIQRGLLSRARRIGTKGIRKGSHGVYPCCVVWQVLYVRALMEGEYTLEQIEASEAWQDVVSIQGTYPRFYSMLTELREGMNDEEEADSRDTKILMDEAIRNLIMDLRRVFTLALQRVEREFP